PPRSALHSFPTRRSSDLPWVGLPSVPSFNVEVVYPDGSHHASWLGCRGATTTAAAAGWTTYRFTIEAAGLAGGHVRGMAVFFDRSEAHTSDSSHVSTSYA